MLRLQDNLRREGRAIILERTLVYLDRRVAVEEREGEEREEFGRRVRVRGLLMTTVFGCLPNVGRLKFMDDADHRPRKLRVETTDYGLQHNHMTAMILISPQIYA